MNSKMKTKITLADGRVISVVRASKMPQDRNTRIMSEVACSVGANAVKAAFAQGLPVTVGKNGRIVKLYPNGNEEVIGVMRTL